jgi:hypothetical protein
MSVFCLDSIPLWRLRRKQYLDDLWWANHEPVWCVVNAGLAESIQGDELTSPTWVKCYRTQHTGLEINGFIFASSAETGEIYKVDAIVLWLLLSCQKWPPTNIFCKALGYKIPRLGAFASGSLV